MEALRETRKMNTLTFRVPAGGQTTFLRTMAKNMGWEQVKLSQLKREAHIPNATTIRAIMDVEAGKVHYAKNLDDLFAQLEI